MGLEFPDEFSVAFDEESDISNSALASWMECLSGALEK
jgi:hypothetical protein